MAYQLTQGDTILRLIDNAFIPQDPANVDFQTYQEWVSQGNTPLPPDPLPEPIQLTPEQKLQQSGLTVEELKGLLGL